MTHTFNAQELATAAAWAATHTAEKHNAECPDRHPDFALRNTGNGGMGTVSHITCETCDKRKVSDVNSHDITDYEVW